MTKNNTPIVVVAFDRPKSLKRILDSISNAIYLTQNIDLIISIDKGVSNQDVVQIANAFEWENGKKIVNYASKNLGLRKHILECASYALEYGSVIILEDDLYMSPCFYSFAIQALSFSVGKEYIGGVSLYGHRKNVHTGKNFKAIDDPYDNWYFQFASSWGQAWTKEQIENFLKWYDKSPNLTSIKDIPKNVLDWSDKSWLKYFIGFLIEKNRYFIYPRVSLSTNFSDVGTHIGMDSTTFQVALSHSGHKKYTFSEFHESNSIYDAFFENQLIPRHLNLDEELLCVDLYGYREDCDTQYWLTTKILDYKPLKQFSRSLKPIDDNIFSNICGDDIFLYDTKEPQKNKYSKDRFREIIYQIKHLSHADAGYLFFKLTILRAKSLWNKIFS